MEAVLLPAPTLAAAIDTGVLPSRLGSNNLEAAIVRLLAEGEEVPEIALHVGFPQDAVAEVLCRMLKRTGSRTPAQLVARMLRSGRMS